VLKCGRTHLQDATPILFSQEISGWRSSLERDGELIRAAEDMLRELALGGTAVGTGLNAPAGFDRLSAEILAGDTGIPFRTAENNASSVADPRSTVNFAVARLTEAAPIPFPEAAVWCSTP